jgi:hypothetical protein
MISLSSRFIMILLIRKEFSFVWDWGSANTTVSQSAHIPWKPPCTMHHLLVPDSPVPFRVNAIHLIDTYDTLFLVMHFFRSLSDPRNLR